VAETARHLARSSGYADVVECGVYDDANRDLARYEELADLKYTDTGRNFDTMAVTVIGTHLTAGA